MLQRIYTYDAGRRMTQQIQILVIFDLLVICFYVDPSHIGGNVVN